MRYSEIKQQITEQDSKSWFTADLGQVMGWMDVLNQNTKYTVPRIGDNIVLMGLVGDPSPKMKRINSFWAVAKENYDELMEYQPDEKINKSTELRFMRLMSKAERLDLSSKGSSTAGWFKPEQMDPEAWILVLDEVIDNINKDLMNDVDQQWSTIVLVHEAIHRGIAVWRKLVQAGLISPSPETNFILNNSNNGLKDGIPVFDRNGEHAMVYYRLEQNHNSFSSRTVNYIKPWIKANKEYLYNNFSIGKPARLATKDNPSFDDRYQDLNQTQDDAAKMDTLEQTYLWLSLAYKTASQEIADVVGKKMLQSPRSPRPKQRPKKDSPAPAPKPSKSGWPSIPPQLDERELVNLLMSIRNKLNTGKIDPNTVYKRLPVILAGATGLKIDHPGLYKVSKMFAARDRSSLSSDGKIEKIASRLIQAAWNQ
jgi:hypothetical protein